MSQCSGCAYEDVNDDEYPCCYCNRISREDMYEPKEDD